ncbi:hypothetical protein AB0L41_17415 [Amycolatopsis mediterranei]|uniref:hypothetical protein n=1 Tax=Amycolatopsis mediterranei TaxID=33910 RepID=UPI0034230773
MHGAQPQPQARQEAHEAVGGAEPAGQGRTGGRHGRRTDADDRRRAVVELTPKAAELLEEVYGPIERAGRALLAEYAPEQLELVIEVLRKGERLQLAAAERIRAR